MRIVQIVPTLAYGDAIGNDVLALKHILQDAGFETDIYAETVAKPLDKNSAKPTDKLCELKAEDVAILHLSTGAQVNQIFAELVCRKIVRYHNVTPPKYFAGNDPYIARVNQWALTSVAFLADKVDYCLADSEFNKEDLIRMGYTCKIDVLPILIPFNDYKREPDKHIREKYHDVPVVLFTGRIAPNKKIEDVIRAFYMYKKYYNTEAVLVLVGLFKETDTYYKKMQLYLEKIKARDVFFTGHIHFDEILAYFCCADIFLCQSEHEGFCVPLVEAMFFDIPIVAYKSSAIPDTLNGSGALMDTKDPLLVAGVMNRIYKDKQWREQLLESERQRLEDFTYEKTRGQFLQYINNFMKKQETL